MNYHKILKYDTANGPGIRTTIWFTGCCFRCPDCFNAEIQDFKAGNLFDESAKAELFSYLSDPHVTGLSILGGEPLAQNPHDFLNLLKEIKQTFPDKNIWMWTGFQLKDIIKQISLDDDPNIVKHLVNNFHLEKISYVDYLVDGPYKKEETKYHTRFRGSSNQIIWHIKYKGKDMNHKHVCQAINESVIFDKHLENTQYNIDSLPSIIFEF